MLRTNSSAQRHIMFNSRLRLSVFIVVLVLALHGAPTHVSADEQARESHCVVMLVPAQENQEELSDQGMTCFASLAESIAAATSNQVRLPATATIDDIDQALRSYERSTPLAGAANYVLSIEFEHPSWKGSSRVFTAHTSCFSSAKSIKSMPSGWSDRISSARGYSGCGKVVHYQHTNFGGASITCRPNCASVGLLNDRTSSIRWYRS